MEPPLSSASTPELSWEYPSFLKFGTKKLEYFHSEMRQMASLRTRHPDPLVEIHPEAAASHGIAAGDWVRLELHYGSASFRVKILDGTGRDVANAEDAWWRPEAPALDHGRGESGANLLHGADHFSPDSGAEPLKCTLCRVVKA